MRRAPPGAPGSLKRPSRIRKGTGVGESHDGRNRDDSGHEGHPAQRKVLCQAAGGCRFGRQIVRLREAFRAAGRGMAMAGCVAGAG